MLTINNACLSTLLVTSLLATIEGSLSDAYSFVEPLVNKQIWNTELSKISQSVFKLNVQTWNESYAATGVLCIVELQGARHAGIHYGFITNQHVISWNMVVPQNRVNLNAVFNASSNQMELPIRVHVDTAGWFIDETIDTAFFEFRPEIVRKLMSVNVEFIHINSDNVEKNVEKALDREIFLFGFPSNMPFAVFMSGNITQNYNGNFGSIYSTAVTVPGFSGSPIVDKKTYAILGIHSSASIENTYRIGTSLEAIIVRMESMGLLGPKSAESPSWNVAVKVTALFPILLEAIRNKDFEQFKSVLREFKSQVGVEEYEKVATLKLLEHPYKGTNLLNLAARKQELNVLELLIQDYGVEFRPFSPLFSSAYSGRAKVVQLILSHKPNLVDSSNFYGNTALNLAAVGNHFEIVQMLVERFHANIDNRGYEGRTPVFMAASSHSLSIVKYLVGKGVNLKLKGSGQTIAHFAAKSGQFEMLKFVLESDQTLADALNDDNNTILHEAAISDNAKLLRVLVEKSNCSLQSWNNQGENPMMTAARHGKLATLAYFLTLPSGKALLDQQDFDGNNILHHSLQSNNFNLILTLAKIRPGLIRQSNVQGISPLLLAGKLSLPKKIKDTLKFYAKD